MNLKIFATALTMIIVFQSGHTITLFDCDFENGVCGFVTDYSVQNRWRTHQGPTDSRNTGPSVDHTSGTSEGFYMYAEASNAEVGEKARIYSPTIARTGSTCSRLEFYYHMYGENMGFLNLYLLGQMPYYFTTPIWQAGDSDLGNQWHLAQIDISISVNYSIAFETVFRRGGLIDNLGDVAIDDVKVLSIDCAYTSCDNNILCLNGGTCATIQNTPTFDYECICVDGWSGEHCENDKDECLNSPCLNNGACIHGLNELSCDCLYGFYGDHCEFIDGCAGNSCLHGGTCHNIGDDFNCTCKIGYTGKICEINIDDCSPDPCQNGGTCTDGTNSYSCSCLDEYYGYNCQHLAGSCDFEDGDIYRCGYKNEFWSLEWVECQGRTPIPSIGPKGDYPTGEGYYVYAEVDNFEPNSIARMVTPTLPKASIGSCTRVTFWYYMETNTTGTLNLYASIGPSASDSAIMWTMSGDQGNIWHQASVDISSPVAYSLVFDSVSRFNLVFIQPSFIGIDDIRIEPNTCDYEQCSTRPCQNGGTCLEENGFYRCVCPAPWDGQHCTEDRNECSYTPTPCLNGGLCVDQVPGYDCLCMPEYVGYDCEYLKGSCDFEDPNSILCEYTQDVTGDFLWTRWQGETPSDLTGPRTDHTIGTVDGFYLYVEASDQEDGGKARVITPIVPGSGSKCTGLDFWYHMFGTDIGELAVYIEFNNEVLTNPIWNMIGTRNATFREWQHVEMNVSAPSDFKLVFEATVLPLSQLAPDNRGDIAIDDIEVHFDRDCDYNKCFEQPCQNGGTCTAIGENDYSCKCTAGYDGKDCDNAPSCSPNPCQNGGNCVIESDGNEACLCNQGFIGDYCETKDYCYPNPCEHGGICNTLTTTYDCDCPSGYLGTNCEVDVNECENDPCQNGAICLDLPGEYSCQCLDGYFGDQCDKIDGGCNFEGGFCEWTSESTEFKWIRNSGPSPNFPFSGPRTDHTHSNGTGYYIFTPVYSDQPEESTKYRLVSPMYARSVIPINKLLSLQFYYHMYGTGIGNLNVYISDGGTTELIDIIASVDDALDWQHYVRKVDPINDFQFFIEHETTSGPFYLADLALDDIDLLIEDAPGFPEPTTKPITTTPTIQTTSSTTILVTTIGLTTQALTSTTKSPPATTAINGKTTITAKDTLSPPTESTTLLGCDDCNNDDEGLDGGAIAGIVIGTIAAIALAIGAILFLRRKSYHSPETQNISNEPGVSNVGYQGDINL